jgi:cell wall-associated NlpC family hydrolase
VGQLGASIIPAASQSILARQDMCSRPLKVKSCAEMHRNQATRGISPPTCPNRHATASPPPTPVAPATTLTHLPRLTPRRTPSSHAARTPTPTLLRNLLCLHNPEPSPARMPNAAARTEACVAGAGQSSPDERRVSKRSDHEAEEAKLGRAKDSEGEVKQRTECYVLYPGRG